MQALECGGLHWEGAIFQLGVHFDLDAMTPSKTDQKL